MPALAAVRRAYETGLVTWGGLGLKSTPYIDYRGYVDVPENNAEAHSRFQSFSTRARLEKANGSSANLVMVVESGVKGTKGLFSDQSPVLSHALTQMDEWLSGLAISSYGARPSLAAIAKAKPADLVDACFIDGGTTKIVETQVWHGDTKCNKLYQAYSSPRMAAGESVANDVLKCQRKPVDPADYGGKLGRDDVVELKSIFARGVCDWSKPGVNQVHPKGVWQSL
jgi:hypothetical protein